MKAILTVVASDREGIIAAVSGLLFENGINILDINQTVLSGYFTMVMLADLTKMKVSFQEMQELLNRKGMEMGMEIRMQRSEIFDAMHRV